MRRVRFLFVALIFIFLVGCTKVSEKPVPADLQKDGTGDIEKLLDGNIQAETVSYGDGYSGYLARPKKDGEFPGVVMIHEWWGLNDNIKQEAKNLAEEGFVVLAVDLYNGNVATDRDEARKYSGAVRNNTDEAVINMKSAVAFLQSHEMVSDSIASMGWCFGGGMSMQLALMEELDATVIYYGRLETDSEKLSSINWPVLGVFGALDSSIPVSSVEEFEKALEGLKIENEIYIYDGVGHAFANPSNPGHDQEKTEDAWNKTILFLNKHLKQG